MGSFFVKLFNFIKSRTFLINIALIIIAVLSIVFGTLSYLDTFTRFGQKIEVPDLVGDKVNLEEIDAYLSGKEIGYEVLDSVYRTDLPPGTVFFQQPGPTSQTGVYVKEGRKVKLRVATRFRMVEMPALAGKTSKRFAEQILENRGLIPVVEFQPSIEGKDQVLEQKYKGKKVTPGEKLPIGSKIVLVVSRGPSVQTVSVPNLEGMTISEARNRLEQQNLSLYVLCQTCPDEASKEKAVVVRQMPDASGESVISAGGTVTVWAE